MARERRRPLRSVGIRTARHKPRFWVLGLPSLSPSFWSPELVYAKKRRRKPALRFLAPWLLRPSFCRPEPVYAEKVAMHSRASPIRRSLRSIGTSRPVKDK